MSVPVVEFRGVGKVYPNGVRALTGINLKVSRGEVVAIVGPSGCGKSTLLKTVNGLESIQEGEVVLTGEVISSPKTDWKSVRMRVGMVFQNYELFPHLSVLKNVLIAPQVVKGADMAVAKKRALALLERVGLADKASAMPRELSGGQKQRVAIVRALMMEPDALLLDEITASLDPEISREVLDVVVDLARDGMTMLLVTHEMGFARKVADRVVFMDAGQIVEVSTPKEFFSRPESTRAQKFLDTFTF